MCVVGGGGGGGGGGGRGVPVANYYDTKSRLWLSKQHLESKTYLLDLQEVDPSSSAWITHTHTHTHRPCHQ